METEYWGEGNEASSPSSFLKRPSAVAAGEFILTLQHFSEGEAFQAGCDAAVVFNVQLEFCEGLFGSSDGFTSKALCFIDPVAQEGVLDPCGRWS